MSAGDRIGIAARSATLLAAADAVQSPNPARAEEVTLLLGGVGNNVLITDTASARRLAEETA